MPPFQLALNPSKSSLQLLLPVNYTYAAKVQSRYL